jgi:hypothetical protein
LNAFEVRVLRGLRVKVLSVKALRITGRVGGAFGIFKEPTIAIRLGSLKWAGLSISRVNVAPKPETYFTCFLIAVFLVESPVADDFIVEVKLPFETTLLCWGCTATRRHTSKLPVWAGLTVWGGGSGTFHGMVFDLLRHMRIWLGWQRGEWMVTTTM